MLEQLSMFACTTACCHLISKQGGISQHSIVKLQATSKGKVVSSFSVAYYGTFCYLFDVWASTQDSKPTRAILSLL
jgi:hypothetical protein